MRDCELLQHSTLADPTMVTACTPTHHAAFQLSSVVLSAHSSHDANWCQNRVMDLYGAPTIAPTHSNERCMYNLTTAMMASGFGQTTTMPGKLTRRRQQQIQNRTVCRWVCVCVCVCVMSLVLQPRNKIAQRTSHTFCGDDSVVVMLCL